MTRIQSMTVRLANGRTVVLHRLDSSPGQVAVENRGEYVADMEMKAAHAIFERCVTIIEQ